LWFPLAETAVAQKLNIMLSDLVRLGLLFDSDQVTGTDRFDQAVD
jgi:hypothetical protein